MYNEERKRRFISERNAEVILPNDYLECQFNKISNVEETLSKDLCNFTFYEITEYYKLLNLTSTVSLSVMNSQFSLYTQWCLQQNLVNDGQNHFLEMRNEDYNNCINKALLNLKIISRDTLLEWVSQLTNPKDQFILLGLFEGIRGKDFCELAKLRKEDVVGNVATLCTGRKLQLSDKLVGIIDDCISETKYYSISGKEKKVMPLIDNGYIIKDYPNTKEDVSDYQRGRQVYNGIKRILQYFDMFPIMSASSIVESGKIDMIKRRSFELNMTCKDYIYSVNIKEVESKYDCGVIIKKTYYKKYEDYLV